MTMKPQSFSLCQENVDYISDQYKTKGKRNKSHWLDDLITHLRERSEPKLPAVKEKKPTTRFTPPTFEDVGRYMCDERGLPAQTAFNEAEKFIDHHSSKGWLIGNSKTKMKDWKAAVRTWLRGIKVPEQKQSGAAALEEKISNFRFND